MANTFPETLQTHELLRAFAADDWQDINGLASLVLISAGGTNNFDFAPAGQMAETPLLQRSPRLKAMMAALRRPLSRSRIIRLPPGEHDLQEHSFHRFVRQVVYIPLLQFPGTQFYQDEQPVALQINHPHQVSGRCAHKIVNADLQDCMFLVCETRCAEAESNAPFLEPHRFDLLTPDQMQSLLAVIIDALQQSTLNAAKSLQWQQSLQDLAGAWSEAFARFGHSWQGELSYQDVLLDFSALIGGKQGSLPIRARQAVSVIESVLKANDRPKPKRHFSRYFFAAQQPLPDPSVCPRFEKPIFIVSAPRAGSTLLFETLAQFPEVWTIGEESHELIEDIPSLHPSAQDYRSNRLTAAQATEETAELLRRRFVRQLRNRAGDNYLALDAERAPRRVRFLEKTPKNALRIPFLKAAFPSALFVYLYRDPEENIASLLEGWRSLRFIAYRNLPAWPHRQWSFYLPERWQEMHDASLAEIAAFQWRYCNDTIINDLNAIPASDWLRIAYADLIANPQAALMQIAQFAGLDTDASLNGLLTNGLPVSKLTLSNPSANKWRKYQAELDGVRPVFEKPASGY